MNYKYWGANCGTSNPARGPVRFLGRPQTHQSLFHLHSSSCSTSHLLRPSNSFLLQISALICLSELKKKNLQIQLAVPAKTSADVKAKVLMILMCAWHQAALIGWWDLFPCSFAWPCYRLVLNLNLAEPSWEQEAQETAATTRHLLASHQVSMALPSHLCLKVSQWVSTGKRVSQWDLGGKFNSWHPLLSTSPAITELFSFSFSLTLTLLQNYSHLLMWISVLPLLPSFQYLPKHAPAHMHNHHLCKRTLVPEKNENPSCLFSLFNPGRLFPDLLLLGASNSRLTIARSFCCCVHKCSWLQNLVCICKSCMNWMLLNSW